MLLQKSIFIGFLFIIIFVWNKYIPNRLVKSAINSHKKYNSDNLKIRPIKFVIQNEENIVKFLKVFYWIGFLTIAYFILTNQI